MTGHEQTPDTARLLAELRDLADEVAHLATARANADAEAIHLAERVALLEQTAPAEAPAVVGHPYRYQHLADWVDEVFARLAAAHRAKWCTNWDQHAEARIRLEVLWHTWESAMASAPEAEPNWAAVDEWLRLRLDHHVAFLLDVDGPFAGCVPARGTDPGRCSAPPPLAQRPLIEARTASLARLEAHRARRRDPSGQPHERS